MPDDRVIAAKPLRQPQDNIPQSKHARDALLDAIEPLLVAAGAVRARGTSKIQRTMQGGGGAA